MSFNMMSQICQKMSSEIVNIKEPKYNKPLVNSSPQNPPNRHPGAIVKKISP